MIIEEEANKKVEEGWFRAWFIFEVLAIDEKVTRESLESLMNKLDKDTRVKIYKKNFGESKRVEKPIEGVEFGYSLTCDVCTISKSFDNLAQITLEYGPSSVEILEPEKFDLGAGEAQSILNSVSHMMHMIASAGAGGIVFLKGEE